MTPTHSQYTNCNFGGHRRCACGEQRLNHRAVKIGKALSNRYGQPLSQVFSNASELKRSYEFFTNSKTSKEKLSGKNNQKQSQKRRKSQKAEKLKKKSPTDG